MSKQFFIAGQTDKTIDVFIQDSSSTVGAGLTGLVYNTASLVCYYRKGATGAATALSLATQTIGGAHSDGGFVAVDGTNMPGLYRLDLSDTMIADAGTTKIYLRGATNMAPCVAEIEVSADVISDLYHADIHFTRDQANTQDEWTVTWFKNGVRVSASVTSPTLQLVKRADGTDLKAATAMTEIGSTESYKLDLTGADRVTVGEAVLAIAVATIDGSSRAFSRLVGRDSS